MRSNFVFMDDSCHSVTQVSSLTALVVPVETYAHVRADFYECLKWAIQPAPHVIANPPELHGRNFLRNQPDERKLEVAEAVARLVRNHNLRLYRIGYFLTPELEVHFPDKLLSLCWSSLLHMMQSLLAQEAIIPVMDGFQPETVRGFSGAVQRIDVLRSTSAADMLSIGFSHNILGEVFYADSRYSVLIQVTDLIAYIRNVADLKQLGRTLSPFKERLSEIAAAIDGFIQEEIISLVFDGKIHGPVDRVRPYGGEGPIVRAVTVTPSDTADIRPPPLIQWPDGPHPNFER